MPKLTDRQCEIINALAFSSINIAETARTVKCARNNIIWHITKIREETGLDPLDFFDLHDLYAIAGGTENADQKATM